MLRYLLILALLLWPACLTASACTAMAAPAKVKKMTGDCCKKGCDCSAKSDAPSKPLASTSAAPDIDHLTAAVSLPLPILLPVAPASSVAPIALIPHTPASVRAQSVLCLWTT